MQQAAVSSLVQVVQPRATQVLQFLDRVLQALVVEGV